MVDLATERVSTEAKKEAGRLNRLAHDIYLIGEEELAADMNAVAMKLSNLYDINVRERV